MIAINLNNQRRAKYCITCKNLPSRSRSSYHVKVFARLWGRVGVDRLHDTFQNVKGREATDASTVKAEEIELLS